MKNKTIQAAAAVICCTLISLGFPSYVHASDGEQYITISVDAVDDNANLQYALDSDEESAFTDTNEFTVPAGTSHIIYVKDAAGNITSQKYDPQDSQESSYADNFDEEDEEEQQINIDLELGQKEEEKIYSPDEEGNPGTASVTNRTKTDGSVDAEKVFYTFTTKEGEELYLVVDQGKGTDNVYLLDTVSLGDLRVLADGQETSSAMEDKEEDNLLSILAEEDNADADSEEEIQPSKKQKSSFGNGLFILLLAGIGGGAYYYLKIYRNKKDEVMDAMDAMDMDEFEPEEDEEEVDFGYDEAEKERYLEDLISEDEEEEELFDQDPEEYATSHMQNEDAAAGNEDEPADEDEADNMFDGMEDF